MSLIDEIFKSAAERGEFSHLPRAGQPLRKEDIYGNPHTPEHLRLAHKVLKDNEMVPEWVAAGQDIDSLLAKLRATVRRVKALAAGEQAGQRAELEERVCLYNRAALTYNLKVPQGVAHKPIVRLQDELARA